MTEQQSEQPIKLNNRIKPKGSPDGLDADTGFDPVAAARRIMGLEPSSLLRSSAFPQIMHCKCQCGTFIELSYPQYMTKRGQRVIVGKEEVLSAYRKGPYSDCLRHHGGVLAVEITPYELIGDGNHRFAPGEFRKKGGRPPRPRS